MIRYDGVREVWMVDIAPELFHQLQTDGWTVPVRLRIDEQDELIAQDCGFLPEPEE